VARTPTRLYRANLLHSDLTARQYAAIGKIACEWAHLESAIRGAIQMITEMDADLLTKFIADMPAAALIDLLITVSHETGKSKEDQSGQWRQLQALHPLLTELRIRRNDAIHGEWTKSKRVAAVHIRFTARDKRELKGSYRRWNTEEFERLPLDIAEATRKVWQIALDSWAYKKSRATGEPSAVAGGVDAF